jgi:hypothetical protein
VQTLTRSAGVDPKLPRSPRAAASGARDPGHDSDLDLERRVEPLESLDRDLSLEGLDRDSLDRDLSLPEAAVSRLIAGRESKLAL